MSNRVIMQEPVFTLAKEIKVKRYTSDEVLAMGISGSFDLIDGRIVYRNRCEQRDGAIMDYTGDEHGYTEIELARHLGNFNAVHRLGWVLGGEVGVHTSSTPDTVRGADILFISRQRLPALRGKAVNAVPELVVEIVSPTDRWSAIRQKIDEYFAIGIERFWVVEPDAKLVWVYRSPTDLSRLTENDTLRGEGILAGFELQLAEMFEPL